MFIYLSKKIAIPHGIPLACVSWNSEQGWIACGGGNGLLKILKLDSKSTDKKTPAAANQANQAQQSNLTMNQTLEGHSNTVKCVTWNESYRKLTTSDENGLIIVWMLHKNQWFEEMINNRNQSTVTSMKWTADGSKICIVYADGAVIVGSVDGNRLWGKELDLQLNQVEWSPDGRHLLFATLQNEVHCFDALGNAINQINIYANTQSSQSKIVKVHWYDGLNGYVVSQAICPQLAIVFDNGRVQIGRDELDDAPVLIDTGLAINDACWNHNGAIIAIAGMKSDGASSQTSGQSSQVQFYTPWGQHLRTLRVPGGAPIQSISWEGTGLRLALAVESFIYFANLRPDYQWGYFSNTLVYGFTKLERSEHCVNFWDTSSDERLVKYVKNLLTIRASAEHCVFATKTDDDSGQFILILCNAIGSPVDSKYIDIEPIYISMTPHHVIVSNGDIVYVWQYSTPMSKLTSLDSASQSIVSKNSVSMAAAKRRENREKSFHIDDPLAGITSNLPELNSSSQTALLGLPSSNDPIVALTATKTTLMIARSSGQLLKFGLPHLSLDSMYVLHCRPQSLALNCNSTRLSIIDINGICTLFDLEARAQTNSQSINAPAATPPGQLLDFERRDAWDMLWSDDNPELFAVMEKSRMYVFRGTQPEEPIQSNCFLAEFSDLCIKAVNLDDILQDPEMPEKASLMHFETKSLRDARQLCVTTPLIEAANFIEERSHPRLWRLLGETALEQLNLPMADKAFVRCHDYQSLQFVKRLKLLNSVPKQRAEVAAYFRRFDEAESIYLSNNQPDLAVELRMRLGDWFRVVQLMSGASGGIVGDDDQLLFAYDRIGDYYADRQKWSKAFKFYSKAKNLARMIDCAYLLDEFGTLVELAETVPATAPFLPSLGEKFASVGLCSEAVSVYLKAGQPKSAIDCCVELNQWEEAVRLAEAHKVEGIASLLSAYASHLLEKEKWFAAVELFRKAGQHGDASKLCVQLAEKEGRKRGKEMRTQKLYVMAAMEMELHKDATVSSSGSVQAASIQSLIDAGASSSHMSVSPWHGAEAFHLLLLSQRHFYEQRYEYALCAAAHLHRYADVLSSKVTQSLLALTAFAAGYFRVASRAFAQLEQSEDLTEEEREKYSQLALNIFLQNRPIDPQVDQAYNQCSNQACGAQMDWLDCQCAECGKDHGICIVTGRSLAGLSPIDTVMCKQCRHRAIVEEWKQCTFCPLCHAPV